MEHQALSSARSDSRRLRLVNNQMAGMKVNVFALGVITKPAAVNQHLGGPEKGDMVRHGTVDRPGGDSTLIREGERQGAVSLQWSRNSR